MAVIKHGIMGGFSGTAGVVNGYHLMGQDIMRGPRRARSSAPSKPELANRDKFSVSQRWLQPITGMVRIGFQDYKPKCHGFVGAKSFISKNAVVQDDAGFHIDPSLACISHGPLDPGFGETVALVEDDTLHFTWDYTSGSYNDRAMVVAYDIEGGKALYDTSLAKRAFKKASFQLGDQFAGKELHIYLGFVSEDRKTRSISKYLGTLTMPEVESVL